MSMPSSLTSTRRVGQLARHTDCHVIASVRLGSSHLDGLGAQEAAVVGVCAALSAQRLVGLSIDLIFLALDQLLA